MKTFWILLIIGIVIILLGVLGFKIAGRKKKRCNASTTAKIVEVQTVTDDKENVTYTPVYEFHVGEKTVRKVGEKPTGNKRKYRAEDKVIVKYNPARPEEFLINGKGKVSIFGIVCVIVGIIVIAVAAIWCR